MVYNPPKTGHVVLILDNGTTAMTGLQEHPGTGRRLGGAATAKLSFENLAHSIGIDNVHVVDPHKETDRLATLIKNALDASELTVIIARRPCLLAAKNILLAEQAAATGAAHA
jgi:indolepyruvate ferredoxin oxidoreductase alpha subunit